MSQMLHRPRRASGNIPMLMQIVLDSVVADPDARALGQVLGQGGRDPGRPGHAIAPWVLFDEAEQQTLPADVTFRGRPGIGRWGSPARPSAS